MAVDRTIAERWARALLEIGDDTHTTERLWDDLRRVSDSFRGPGKEAYAALCTPVFTLEERRNVLGTIVRRFGLHPMSANVLGLLLDKGRMEALLLIIEIFGEQADERAGRVRVRVQSAEPLTPALEAEVRAALERRTGKRVVLQTEVAPELLGGMVAHLGGVVYDASLRSRLDRMRSTLLSARLSAEA
jgi:F-type H+-transporting ATPase subunit delta